MKEKRGKERKGYKENSVDELMNKWWRLEEYDEEKKRGWTPMNEYNRVEMLILLNKLVRSEESGSWECEKVGNKNIFVT